MRAGRGLAVGMPGLASRTRFCDYDVIMRSAVENPTVSVIVAIHDMGENGYLSECLESFAVQTCAPGRVEYVLADDCSTDNSLEIACAWARGRDDATVLHLHENMRQGSARNRAIFEARGAYFAIVDADDWVSPDYFETIVAELDATGADAVMSKYIQLVDGARKPIAPLRRNVQDERVLGDMTDEKMRVAILKHWQFGVWPRRLYEDSENWLLEGRYYEDTPAGTRWIMQLRKIAEGGGARIITGRTKLPPRIRRIGI